MEQEQQNTQASPMPSKPVQENAFPSATEKTGTSNYALVGGLIGLVIIALGGWYLMMRNDTQTVAPIVVPSIPENVATPETIPQNEPDPVTNTLKVQSTSDELTSIEADLNATNLGALKDINQI